jgi:DNA-binding NarL/FixJ family response regulator
LTDVVRVLVADDQPLVRQGLRLFLDLQPDLEVVGEAADGSEAVALARDLRPDVVVMDLVMPGLDGVEATRAVRDARPDTHVLVLTSFVDDDKVLAVVRAGAAGYLLKDARPEEVADAIRAVRRGEPLLGPEIARRLMRQLSEPNRALEGTVTILFTDIVGSTDLVERLGDERARAVFRDHDGLLREALGRHAGVEVKHRGDGLMVAFTSARRALRCAVEMQRTLRAWNRDHPDTALGVRIGINTGEVIAEDEDYFGAAVALAARIAAAAGGGQILVSAVSGALAGSEEGWSLVDRGQHSFRGLREPCRVYEVVPDGTD